MKWQRLAERQGARFGVIECVCSDLAVHRVRVEDRRRDIPGWYELDWDQVVRGRELYEPLAQPKVLLDAVDSPQANLERIKRDLLGADD